MRISVGGPERVGAVLVRPDQRGDRGGELAEAARHDHHARAAGPHGPGEGARARIELDAALQHIVDDADRQAYEQRDALAQRRLEGDLAAHRPLGDGRDVVAEAHDGRKLVDAFLANQGGVHVGHEQPLLAPFERLDDHVDGLALEMRAQARARLREVPGEHEVGGGAFVEPAPPLDPAEG